MPQHQDELASENKGMQETKESFVFFFSRLLCRQPPEDVDNI